MIGDVLMFFFGLAFRTTYPGVCETCIAEADRHIWQLLIGLLCAVAVAHFVFNRRYPIDKAYKTISEFEHNLIEVLLQEGLEEQFLVELTMENGKVYIGHPLDSGISRPGGDVAIVPFVSGYRHAKTKTFRLTTFYVDALNKFTQGTDAPLRTTDFHIVLPKNAINSARRFDLGVYQDSFATGRTREDLGSS